MNLNGSKPRSSLAARVVRASIAGLAAITVAGGLATGCLDRPVAEQNPTTTNIFVEQYVNTVIDKIDLLFMIDNSVSMADKQEFFADAVPKLVDRLINPQCVDASGAAQAPTGGDCPEGFEREFKPVNNIHIGVVTSSLGSFGGFTCSEQDEQTQVGNDRGHLVGSLARTNLAAETFQGQGFLAWGSQAGATNDATTLINNFRNHVTQAGEQGCGYEASLEAWYRFLIDPKPYQQLVQPEANGPVFPQEVDQTVLTQRAAFLRPDSLVTVIMLTDENDCSVRTPGLSWLVTLRSSHLPRATSACAQNPNDKCCQSCGSGPISGCTAPADDAECKKGQHDDNSDPLNLRCFRQKERFGIDLLYPTARYAVGLSRTELCPDSPHGDADCQCAFAREQGIEDCAPGQPVPNPLFWDAANNLPAKRDPTLVYFAGVVGVPWQDIATEESLSGPGLKYLTAPQLSAAGRWDVIVGDIYNNIAPSDPFMIESVNPRMAGAANPVVNGAAILPANATTHNAINGHEWQPEKFDDLQYACIFPIQARDCAEVGTERGCDCDPDENPEVVMNPLCQPAGGGAYGTTQYSAKGYPGLRHLDALRRFGDNSIVGSICPKITDNPNAADYGYNPAVNAIVDRLKEALGGTCLPRKLVPTPEGEVPCRVVEALTPNGGACMAGPDLQAMNRTDTRTEDPKLAAAVLRQLKNEKRCDGQTGIPCDQMCLYTIGQMTGEQLTACQNETAPNAIGYCYIDPENGVGDEALVADCPASEKRLLRFVGDNTPQNNALTFIACTGAAFNVGEEPAAEPTPEPAP